jgi:hypothetical protein
MLEKRKDAPSSTTGREVNDQSSDSPIKRSRTAYDDIDRGEYEAEDNYINDERKLEGEYGEYDEYEDDEEEDTDENEAPEPTSLTEKKPSRSSQSPHNSRRDRRFNNSNKSDNYERPQKNPVYGQKSAFPGLDELVDGDTLLYGDPEDGLEYLRMVR